MEFAADIIVMAPNVPDVTLVVEIKATLRDVTVSEAQLKQYMLDRKCSLGLLVTPQSSRIYRDTFADFTANSITLVGEFPTSELLDVIDVPQNEKALRHSVQSWLERLASSWPSALPSSDSVKTPVLEFLVPEVAEGRVASGSLG